MARILPIFVPHAGCPCQCVFCNQRAIAAQRPLSPQEMTRQLAENLAKIPGQTAQAAFYGGSFTAIPWQEQKALLEAVQPFLKAGKIESIRLSTRPDAIDEEILERLRLYGVKTIELGAQSMSDEVLEKAKRGHKAADTIRAAKWIHEAGFSLVLQLMVGLPGDSREGCLRSVWQAAALKPDGVRLYPVAVLPDTELAQLYEQGCYQPLTVEQAADWCADGLEVLLPAGIPVIRLGLNPTEELGEQVMAGAYHPALGELCYGEWFYRRMKRLLDGKKGNVTFLVHPADLSKAIGQKRRNLLRLQKEFFPGQVQIQAGDVEKYQIRAEDKTDM